MQSSSRISVLFFAAVLSLGIFIPWRSAAGQTIVLDAAATGKRFDGVGAISGGGGNSRLLIDYPEPSRSQILDYLFKPGYGANLQILKVEIGADMDSTDGAEPSHMHTASDENYDRGYEWWLMEQARARNPEIKLAALAWGAPQWVGNGNYWSHDMIEYIIKWIKHAETDHHLTIDYLGGRNERGYNIQWYKDLKAGLRANGLGSIPVIASDDWEKNKLWNIASEMKKDPALNDSIDIVGVHGPSFGGYPTADAVALSKPLWDSEAHFDEKPASYQMARSINRNYVAGKVTATIFWPIVSAMYDNLPYDDIGLIKCNQPWSGHYVITPSLWVMAHTAQFTRPGWQYLDSASGFFAGDTTGGHGSFATLKSPDSGSFSTIVESVDAHAPQAVHFRIAGFPSGPVHEWSTNIASSNASEWFSQQADIVPTQGEFSLTVQPGFMYSLTTVTVPTIVRATPSAAASFTLPYAENFDEYSAGKSPKYFSDMYGAFETQKCAAGRSGMCLLQASPAEATAWKKTSNRPFTIVGNLDWSDYRVSADVLLEQPGSVDLIGRLSGMSDADTPNSYVLRVSDIGRWTLLKTTTKNVETLLASGMAPAPGLNRWHTLELVFERKSVTAKLDGLMLTTLADEANSKGMAGLGVVGYAYAQFDNFKVEALTPTP